MPTISRRLSPPPGAAPAQFFRRRGRRLSACGLLALLLALALGCRRSERKEETAPSAPDTSASTSAQVRPTRVNGRCAPHAGTPSLWVGAEAVRPRQTNSQEQAARVELADSAEGAGERDEERSSRGAAEFGRGATDGSAFMVGLLNHAEDSRALVAFIDGAGARLIELGRVEPNALPPRVAALGGHYLALVGDASVSAKSWRLLGFAKNGAALDKRLGPEVRRAARDGDGADLAVLAGGQALVVWERSRSPEGSEIVGLPVDAPSLREKTAPVVLTPPGHAASEPRLLAGTTSFWLLWLAEQSSPERIVEGDGAGLLVEPPSVLYARELDALGRPRGEPIAINAGEPSALVFDARVLPSDRLLVVHRAAPADRPTDDQPAHLSIVEAGVVRRGPPAPAEEPLGPGVPTLLGLPGVELSFLAIEDAEGKSALARVLAGGAVQNAPVTGLEGRVAIAGDPGRLLTAQARGIGVELEVQTCTLD